ncbi:MAG: COG2426 family protein [Pyrodictiaceae archaeon]
MEHYVDYLYVYLLSLLPSYEGRYAVVTGVLLGLNPLYSLAIASLGVATLSLLLPNVLPAVDQLAEALAGSRIQIASSLAKLYTRYLWRARSRASTHVKRYGVPGLIVFVALPLPGTGVWTGSLAAYVVGMDKSKAILALFVGGFISNLITFIPSYMAVAGASP